MRRGIQLVAGLVFALVFVFGSVSWVAAQDGNGTMETLFLPVVMQEEGANGGTDTPDTPDKPDMPDTSEYDQSRLDVVALVNAERETLGCPLLVIEDPLMDASQGWSEYMAEHSHFEHSEQAWYEKYGTWRSYENILWGCDNAQCAFDTWMASDQGHREAMLVCEEQYTGYFIGVGREGTWWTLAIRVER
jgi:uncharacterized protein YkwD